MRAPVHSNIELLPLPAAHARALQLLNDPNSEIAALAQVIESDPALTASLLRAANSALSAPVHRIDTANVAVIRLGLAETRRLTVGAVASSAFAHLHRAELDVDEVWRHMVATAMLTQAASWRDGVPRGAVSEAFTAGMLHDIGRLSMATQDPGRYSLVATMARGGAEVLEVETRVFGFDHCTWGERVAEVWNIPDHVRPAVVHHHGDSDDPLARATKSAREIAWSLGIGDGLLTPEEETFPEQPEHAHILDEIGGADGLFEHIEWYRGALGAPAPPAARAS